MWLISFLEEVLWSCTGMITGCFCCHGFVRFLKSQFYFDNISQEQTVRWEFEIDKCRAVFLNLFWFTSPFLTKNFWLHPYISKLLLCSNLEAYYSLFLQGILIWRFPWDILTASQLRTTGVEGVKHIRADCAPSTEENFIFIILSHRNTLFMHEIALIYQ